MSPLPYALQLQPVCIQFSQHFVHSQLQCLKFCTPFKNFIQKPVFCQWLQESNFSYQTKQSLKPQLSPLTKVSHTLCQHDVTISHFLTNHFPFSKAKKDKPTTFIKLIATTITLIYNATYFHIKFTEQPNSQHKLLKFKNQPNLELEELNTQNPRIRTISYQNNTKLGA